MGIISIQSFHIENDINVDNHESETLNKYSANASSMGKIEVNESDIALQLLRLTEISSSGPDGIPLIFLKRCHKQMVRPIYLLINKSTAVLNSTTLSIESIVPIFKLNITLTIFSTMKFNLN